VLDRLRHRVWGLSARLIASYILVTLAVVVLVEALVLGFQVPSLVNGAQLQAQVDAAAKSYGQELAERYPDGLPAGIVLGEDGLAPQPGLARPAPDGTLVVPAITRPVQSSQAVTAVVALAADGKVIASSVPARYQAGGSATSELPVPAAEAIKGGPARFFLKNGAVRTPYGTVLMTVWPVRRAPAGKQPAAGRGLVAYVYVQAPWSPRFISPIRAWSELGQLGETGQLLSGPFALLIVIVPVGVLFGLLASRRLVRRVRRLERATLAVADGDYTVTLPVSGRDEVGRLEANFTTMTRQLGSALAAERRRATGDAQTAERARIAREVHDAISQHLFGLRMIAAGMCRADPDNQQARAIERISEDAQRDMQALLIELRPAGLDDAGRPIAIGDIGRTHDMALAANFHQLQGFSPARNDPVKRHRDRLTALDGTVEHLAVDERALVIDGGEPEGEDAVQPKVIEPGGGQYRQEPPVHKAVKGCQDESKGA